MTAAATTIEGSTGTGTATGTADTGTADGDRVDGSTVDPATAGPGDTRPVSRPDQVDGLADAVAKFLRQPSARVLAAQAMVLAALRAREGRPDRTDAAIVAGVAVWWPLQEWLAHRYILHAAPRQVLGRTIDPTVARMHREHHADPWNNAGLPMRFLVPAVPVHAAVWALITRNRRRALTGMLAFGTTTLLYEWTHWLTHTDHRPRRAYFRKLQRRHRLHHFKDEHNWLGFTVPYVDDLFGTAPDPSGMPTSPTVRTLGITDDPGSASGDGRAHTTA